MRLALELVFEGLQAAGLPGPDVAGVTSGQHAASLRVGDAVTVTLAPAAGAQHSAAAQSATEPAPKAGKFDTAAKPGAGNLGLVGAAGAGAAAAAAAATAQHLIVEWEGGAMSDLLADAVIAVLLQVCWDTYHHPIVTVLVSSTPFCVSGIREVCCAGMRDCEPAAGCSQFCAGISYPSGCGSPRLRFCPEVIEKFPCWLADDGRAADPVVGREAAADSAGRRRHCRSRQRRWG